MNKNTVTILHNPRCTKSRQTLALLHARGCAPDIIKYLQQPLQPELLRSLLKQLNMQPAQLLRSKEPIYKELGLAAGNHSDAQLLQIMLEHPILIERPIVAYRGKAVIGRPPEAVLSLFD
jgi:arsenate reductase